MFVPTTAPRVEVERLRGYGARVHRSERNTPRPTKTAMTHVESTGALFCHAYDQPDIAADAGVIGEELLENVPDLHVVVVAVGGGGLFAGVAAALEGRGRVVAVEPVTAPTLHAALREGRPVDVVVSGVAADALGARRIGDVAFEVASRTKPTRVLVDDDAIIAARASLWQDYRMVAEHGAATARAALTSAAWTPSPSTMPCRPRIRMPMTLTNSASSVNSSPRAAAYSAFRFSAKASVSCSGRLKAAMITPDLIERLAGHRKAAGAFRTRVLRREGRRLSCGGRGGHDVCGHGLLGAARPATG